jgi:hypothetical protein
VLRIMPDQKPSKLARLKKRACVVGDLDSIVHMNWLKEWSETYPSTREISAPSAPPRFE